jgi:hypothetical protein
LPESPNPKRGRAPGIPGVARGIQVLIWAFSWHLDALLPSVALERMTIERLMPALVMAAANGFEERVVVLASDPYSLPHVQAAALAQAAYAVDDLTT